MSWSIRIHTDADYEQFKLFRDFFISRFHDLEVEVIENQLDSYFDWFIHFTQEPHLGVGMDYYTGDCGNWNNRFNTLSWEISGANEFRHMLHVIIPIIAFQYFPKIFVYESEYGKIFKTSLSYESHIIKITEIAWKSNCFSSRFIELSNLIKSTEQKISLYDFVASRQVKPKSWWTQLWER